jgi:membrane protein
MAQATIAASNNHHRATSVERGSVLASVQSGIQGKLASLRSSLERYALVRIVMSLVKGFQKDRVTNAAAAMTYYGIFSLFPLLLLFMALAGLALQSNEQAREQILNIVVGLLPQGQDQLKQVIAGVIDAKGAAAGVGILILLWSALGWFQVIDYNVNQIWGVDKPRSFVRGKLFALAMVAAIGGVALTSWVASAAISVLSAHTQIIPGSTVIWQVTVSALSVLTIAGAFLVLYRFTPRREIVLADVWPAALTTAILWELTRRVVAFYLEQNIMVSGYGPVGAAMALLFWVYVSSIIILLGAELGYAIAKERRRILPGEEMVVVAPRGEQPTPKFAPQVGQGFEDPNQREPVDGVSSMDGTTSNEAGAEQDRRGPSSARKRHVVEVTASRRRRPTGRGPVKHLLWAGLTAVSMAITGLAARRLSAGLWEAMLHEPPPTDKV